MRDSKAVAALEEFGGVAVAAQAVEGAGGEEDARGAGADGGGADYAVDDGGDDGDSAADKGDYEGGLGGGSGCDGEGGVVKSPVLVGEVSRVLLCGCYHHTRSMMICLY